MLISLFLCVLALIDAVVGHSAFPWGRTPLKASPGIGHPELIHGNRSTGVLTDGEVQVKPPPL